MAEGPNSVGSPRGRVPRRRRAARTITFRLTALYGTVFLITGAVLLTIGYFLVRSNIRTHGPVRAQLEKLGIHPTLGGFYGYQPGSATAKLIHAVEQQVVSDALHRLLLEYVGALVAMTAISVLAGWWLARRALAPLRAITATARRVSLENLGERIALTGPADELTELADTFDGMLGRLDAAFASQRHFVASASHELRTPLAIMRTEVDVALADPGATNEELRAMGEALRETVDRCERLIASLLLLARSDAAAGHEEPVDVGAMAGDCITDLRVQAEEARVTVRDDLEPAWTVGDPSLIERLVANLLDNGIRHNQPDGWLDVTTRVRGGRVVLTVANGGPAIDADEVQALAEPFRRLDRATPGFGLGLSIVRSVAEAHRGTATLSAREQGGLEVRVELPAMTAVRTLNRAAVTDPGRAGILSGDSRARLTES
jgi:signal transduction histidine kinase